MAQHKREEIELEAPLLGDEYPSKEEQEEKGVGLTGGTLNLIKCVIGAGLLAIPRAFALLGAVAGSLGLAFVTFLTIVTIKYGLVYPSTSFGGPRQFLFLGTYSQTVRHWVGKRGEVVLTVMMVIGLLGFQASCLDILADILLGNDSNNGLLRTLISYFCKCHVSTPFDSDRLQAYQPTAACLNNPGLSHFYLSSSLDTSYDLGHHSHSLGPSVGSPELSPSLAWLMDRRIVLAQVLILFVLPLSLKRNMSSLSVINGVGLLALFAFLASVVSLAAIALKKGVAHRLPLWPNYKELGSEPLLRLMNGFGVLSVLLTAQACHGNIHPLMAIVKPYTKNRVNQIVTLTMVICFFFYAAVCVCAYLVFGNGIQEDILTNLSWRAMEPLIGRWPANIIANLLRVAYMISVMGTAVLNLFPLRQTVADLIMGPPPKPTSSIHTPRPDSESSSGGLTPVQSTNHFQHVIVLEVDASSLQQRVRSHAAWRAALHVPLTVALLGMAYILAVTVPSIWVMISLIGSVSITIMSFLMPAAVGWAALSQLGQISSFKQFKIRALLFIAAILGALMFVNGFVSLYLANSKSDGKDKKH